ncbi:hypothetical protein AB0P05_26625 [Streptomyces flaveolus]|uniref:hypothetical protein n=1 Tax=Streptomyces flaveolus TaxID=67297 RepID=UPI00341C2D32
MSVCLNDTNGDGDCAACARNPEAPCRVSARDAVHRLFESGRTSYRLDAYLDAYAHELAEKIRNEPSPRDPDDYGALVDAGADWAADLIDPEVST